jgi:hypothetical protein
VYYTGIKVFNGLPASIKELSTNTTIQTGTEKLSILSFILHTG